MKINRAAVLSCVCALAACSSVSAAAEFASIGNFSFLGGQYFYAGSPSSLSGHLSASVSPSWKFGGGLTGIFTYSGSYRGTKEVAELAGGGTLFQDSLSNVASVKFVVPAAGLKLRPSVSYRKELLRETLDEQWMKGLFDYDKISAGVEAEYGVQEKHSVALGADAFTIVFPNYASLESRQTSDLGREQAGAKTLDTANIMATLRTAHSFGPKLKLRLSAFSLSKNFPEQPVAVSLDALSPSQKRADTLVNAGVSASYPFAVWRRAVLIAEPGYSYTALDSNQNRADARKARFLPDYYDYAQITPSFSAHLLAGRGNPAVLTAAASVSSKNYPSRPAQNEAGDYGDQNIRVDETLVTLAFSYPAAKDMKAVVSASNLKSVSNMKYESVYKYNFESSAYFAGFSYDF